MANNTGKNYEMVPRLLRRVKELEQNPSRASADAGLSKDYIRNMERAPKGSIRTDKLMQLAKALEISPQQLLTGDDVPFITDDLEPQRPKYAGIVEAGAFRAENGYDQDAENTRVPFACHPDYPPGAQGCFEVVGDSMLEANILDGMWALTVQRETWERRNGDLRDGKLVVACRIRAGGSERELTVKQLRIFPDRIELQPRNSRKNYDTFVLFHDGRNHDGSDFEIIGVLLYAGFAYD